MRRFVVLMVALLVGCTSSEEEIPPQPEGGLPLLGSDCDPMVPAFCGLPFPSNVYLLDDPTGENPSGKSVRFGATTLPRRKQGDVPFPPELLHDHDGFSPGQAPMTYLPLASTAGCATPYDIERSLDDDSPTVLVEADTGRRVPHWVDVDASTSLDGSNGSPDERLFMLRPAERLRDGTRYLVAIRNVVDRNGAPIAPSPVFAALRAGEILAEGDEAARWTSYARRELYADIFARLAAAGVPKDDLVVAWDYTTASKQNLTSRMVEMRDKALAAVGDEGPTFVVSSVEEAPDDDLLRRIEVTMTVPLYLTAASLDHPAGAALDRFNLVDGELVQNGTMEMQVLILVPKSVETAGPHGLLQNGHGLFGSRREGRGGYLARAANLNHYIAFAVNYFGFDEDSVPLAADALIGNFEGLSSFIERQHQGMINQLLAMRMMMGRVASEGISDGEGTLLLDPAWIDPSVRAYRGDSQGGIMGATYMALSTDVTRGLLGEPGMPYNLLLNRSVDWPQYGALLNAGFGGGAAAQIMLGIIQLQWDRTEPTGYAPYVMTDLLPDTPAHRVLMHVARGDHQVTTFGAHLMARAIGAVHLRSDDPAQPYFAPIFGLEEADGPLSEGSALVEYDFGLADNPSENLPNDDGCDPHDRVRDLLASYQQQDAFFRAGTIGWTCIGACNCDDVGSDPDEEIDCDKTFADQCQ